MEHCTGTPTDVRGHRLSTYKTHGDGESARRCQKRWLRAENSRRETTGEPILLGGKPERLKLGKGGARWHAPRIRG